MSGRHLAPRTRSSRPLSRIVGDRASAVVAAVPKPGAGGAIAVVGVTSMVLGLGVLSTGEESVAKVPTGDAAAAPGDAEVAGWLAEREQDSDTAVSRSGVRTGSAQQRSEVSEQRATKVGHLPVAQQSMAGQVTQTVEPSDPRDIASSMMAEDFGWGSDQFSCLNSLYLSESNWDHTATNPSSGAYGIPQSLPGEKMAAAGSDWRTNPATQIEWGLDYIAQSYGTPCSAWAFKSANNWY